MLYRRIQIFDLDQTILDSSHRYRSLPNGDIDLSFWRAMSIPEEILKDKTLPLVRYMRESASFRDTFTAICTSRVMTAADWQLLTKHSINYDYIMYRLTELDTRACAVFKRDKILHLLNNLRIPPREFHRVDVFDDHQGVLAMSKQLGMSPYDATILNRRWAHG